MPELIAKLPAVAGPRDAEALAIFVPGMGTNGYGKIADHEDTTAIECVSAALHETGIPTAHVDLGLYALGGKIRYEADLDTQAERLGSCLDTLKIANYDRVIYVAQSLGSYVLLKHLEGHKAKNISLHLWAPPSFEGEDHAQRLASQFAGKPGAQIDFDGQSVIPCRGGRQVVIPSKYWEQLNSYDVRHKLKQVTHSMDHTHAFFASEDYLYPRGWEYYADILNDQQMTILPGNSHTFRYEDMRHTLTQVSIRLAARTALTA